MHKRHLTIYHTPWHFLAAPVLIAAPFLLLLVLSLLYHLPMATLFVEVAVSTGRLAIAYAIAIILGWMLAVSFYHGRRAAVALPVFDVLQSVPVFAILPLAVFFWGPSNVTVIFFLVLAVIWPAFFSIISSLKLIRRDWEEAVAISGLSGFPYLTRFLIPASIPGVITGSIIGLGEGWEALVASEIIVGIQRGIGGFFLSVAHNPVLTAFGVFGLLFFIFSINKLVWLPLLEWSHREMSE